MSSSPLDRYVPPIADLLAIGHHRSLDRPQPHRWLDYPQQFGLTAAHAPELLHLAVDAELDQCPPSETAAWAPLHAGRAIAQLGYAAALPALCARLTHPDEYRYRDFPACCEQIGFAALAPLTALLQEHREIKGVARTAVIRALTHCGQQLEELYPHCVRAIATQLQPYARQSPELNSLLVQGLVQLNAVEQADLIQAVLRSGRVDLTLTGDWETIQADLGLIPRSRLIERQIQASQQPLVDFTAAAATAPATHPAPHRGFGAPPQASKSRKPRKPKP